MSKQFEAITIPKWGIEMTHGRIVDWKYAEGDVIEAGVELVEIETDKIVNSFEARVAGTLARIVVPEGDELPVGALIGVIARDPYHPDELDAFIAAHRAEPPAGTVPAESSLIGDPPTAAAPQALFKISPALSRKLARAGIEPSTVTGSGPGGRILKEDVDRAIAAGQAAPAMPGLIAEEVRLPAAQQAVAKRLMQAQGSVPLFHLQYRLEMAEALEQFRTAHPGISGSINILLMQGLAAALQEMPELNLTYDGAVARSVGSGNIGVAVARTDNAVAAPVIAAVEVQTAEELAGSLHAAIERARSGRLNPDDQSPAAIAISNLGGFGVTTFTAMVTPPQVMVLSVGALQRVPVWDDSTRQFVPREVLDVTLGCDHRVVNGAQGAALLQRLGRFMQRP